MPVQQKSFVVCGIYSDPSRGFDSLYQSSSLEVLDKRVNEWLEMKGLTIDEVRWQHIRQISCVPHPWGKDRQGEDRWVYPLHYETIVIWDEPKVTQ